MTARGSDIRSAVKSLVEAGDSSGLVYDYGRFAADWSDFLDLFKTTVSGAEVIRGWEVTLMALPVLQTGTDRFVNLFDVQVRGYFGVDDSAESEKTAWNAAEDVVIHLRKYRKMDNTLTQGSYRGAEGWPSIDVFEPRVFGSVLCHYIEINFRLCENETVTFSE